MKIYSYQISVISRKINGKFNSSLGRNGKEKEVLSLKNDIPTRKEHTLEIDTRRRK